MPKQLVFEFGYLYLNGMIMMMIMIHNSNFIYPSNKFSSGVLKREKQNDEKENLVVFDERRIESALMRRRN
jgi:hypothetical protein